jgi:NADPH-dependent curcumin reductase CurA
MIFFRCWSSFDYASQFDQAIEEMSRWIGEGKLKRKFHVVEGLEKCPEHLNLLYSGGNTGKL